MQMRGRPVCEQYQASGLLMWFFARRREQPARRAERLSCGTDEVLFPRTRIHYTLGLVLCLSLFFVAAGGVLFPQSLSAAPAYVQSNYATLHPTATAVPVQYTGAQTAGNLDVVIVGWSDSTAHVSSERLQGKRLSFGGGANGADEHVLAGHLLRAKPSRRAGGNEYSDCKVRHGGEPPRRSDSRI
jgi:hypothetical protein